MVMFLNGQLDGCESKAKEDNGCVPVIVMSVHEWSGRGVSARSWSMGQGAREAGKARGRAYS